MSNMGYCLFQNTLLALQECSTHLHDGDLSEDEDVARLRLAELCQNIAEEFDDIEENEDIPEKVSIRMI